MPEIKRIINLNYLCIVINIIMKLWLTLGMICKIRLLHFKRINHIKIRFKILQFKNNKLIHKLTVLLVKLNNNMDQNKWIILMYQNKWIIPIYRNRTHKFLSKTLLLHIVLLQLSYRQTLQQGIQMAALSILV